MNDSGIVKSFQWNVGLTKTAHWISNAKVMSVWTLVHLLFVATGPNASQNFTREYVPVLQGLKAILTSPVWRWDAKQAMIAPLRKNVTTEVVPAQRKNVCHFALEIPVLRVQGVKQQITGKCAPASSHSREMATLLALNVRAPPKWFLFLL